MKIDACVMGAHSRILIDGLWDLQWWRIGRMRQGEVGAKMGDALEGVGTGSK